MAMITPGIQWEVLGQTANVSDVPAPPGKWDAVTRKTLNILTTAVTLENQIHCSLIVLLI